MKEFFGQIVVQQCRGLEEDERLIHRYSDSMGVSTLGIKCEAIEGFLVISDRYD